MFHWPNPLNSANQFLLDRSNKSHSMYNANIPHMYLWYNFYSYKYEIEQTVGKNNVRTVLNQLTAMLNWHVIKICNHVLVNMWYEKRIWRLGIPLKKIKQILMRCRWQGDSLGLEKIFCTSQAHLGLGLLRQLKGSVLTVQLVTVVLVSWSL